MKKRFVAFLLVLIMVLGMLPVSAMASFDESETTSVDKMDAVPTDEQKTMKFDAPSVQAGFVVEPYNGQPASAELYSASGVTTPGQSIGSYTARKGSDLVTFSMLPRHVTGSYTIWPDIYRYVIETNSIQDPNGILDGEIKVYGGKYPNSRTDCAKLDVPISKTKSGTAVVPVTLYFYSNEWGEWEKCTYIWYVTSVNGGNVPTIPVDWDREHEIYVPVGYTGGIDFAQTFNIYYYYLRDLEVVSENPAIATVTGSLIKDDTWASVNVTGQQKGDTAVYATYTYGNQPAITYTEKIVVHVIDPYTLTVAEGEYEDYIHQLRGVSASAIDFDADNRAPRILSGSEYFSIGYCTDDDGESIDDYIALITDESDGHESGGVAIRVTGNKVGQGVIKASFGYTDNRGGTHAYVDVINVTVTKRQDPQPETPAPKTEDIDNKAYIQVDCTTGNSGHGTLNTNVIAGTYDIGPVVNNTCTITIKPDKLQDYADVYTASPILNIGGKPHTAVANQTPSFTLEYVSGTWDIRKTGNVWNKAVIHTTCTTTPQLDPPKPPAEDKLLPKSRTK